MVLESLSLAIIYHSVRREPWLGTEVDLPVILGRRVQLVWINYSRKPLLCGTCWLGRSEIKLLVSLLRLQQRLLHVTS